jgi:hypothetical protein
MDSKTGELRENLSNVSFFDNGVVETDTKIKMVTSMMCDLDDEDLFDMFVCQMGFNMLFKIIKHRAEFDSNLGLKLVALFEEEGLI